MRICDDLRQAVLQAAIQGKLTTQLPEDGNAKDLLKQIAAEKAELIKEGKIKKEKPLPEITPDEVPFDIPENWKWVRLGDCGFTNIGLTYKPSNINSEGTIVLRSNNIQNGKMDYSDLVKVKMDIPENKICKTGDILICARNGSKRLVGKSAIIDRENMSFGAFMAIFRTRCNYYINYLIQSPYFRKSVLGDAGTTTINQITQDMLRRFICPIPPLAEQQRIVARVEELMARIDDLEKTETELEKLKATFPGDMKAALLQAAMQGKLTEQLPEDGDAADLLEQIAKEKSQLIKEGKIKKEKPLPEITPDEVPFDIPENWQWVRLEFLADINGGFAFKSSNFSLSGIRVVRISDFSESGFINTKIVRHPYKNEYAPYLLEKNNILLCMTGGTVGKSLFVTHLDEPMLINQRVATIKVKTGVPSYINYNVIGPLIQTLIQNSKNSTNDNISMETIKSFPIPLPPLAEQKRIVEKLDKLLPLCDGLIEK